MTAPKDTPCDWCGKDTGCTCPPCDCLWCRYRRGEATPFERRRVEAQDEAFRLADTRRDMRASAARMTAKIDALLGRST